MSMMVTLSMIEQNCQMYCILSFELKSYITAEYNAIRFTVSYCDSPEYHDNPLELLLALLL
jgi:hypothetical protein